MVEQTKQRIGIAIVAVTVIGLSAVGYAAAQEATPEPTAEATAEATANATREGGRGGRGGTQTPRAYLGIRLELTDDGVLVSAVLPDSAAADGGVQSGDVITAIDGASVASPRDLQEAVAALSVGNVVTLTLTRDGSEQTLDVMLAEAPARTERPQVFFDRGDVVLLYDAEAQTYTVRAVNEASALYTAGLRNDDVITAIDGQTVDPLAATEYLDGLADDATVTLTVTRGTETVEVEAAAADIDLIGLRGFQERGGQMFGFGRGGDNRFGMMPFRGGFGYLGLSFTPLNAENAVENDLTVTEGALVNEVVEGSPAAEAGLQTGDVITSVNGEAISEEVTLRDRVSAYEAGDEITLSVLRAAETLEITVTLGEPELYFEMLPFGENFPGMRGFNFGRPGMPGMRGGEMPNGGTPSSPAPGSDGAVPVNPGVPNV